MDCLRKHFHPGVLLNDRYETVSPLNHGSFGMVVMGRDRRNGKLVAIKCLNKASAVKNSDSPLMIDERSEELSIHSRITYHPNIVNFLDSFETDTHTYIVLEYCSMGDLYEAIRQDKGPKETEHVREFMLQLVDAIEYLHKKGIYHRDIKPENIFLTETGKMKLGDFGLATRDVWSYESAVGSDRYMAPEQYDHQGHGLSPAKADIWSIGICLLNILFSRNPFGVPADSDPLYTDFVIDRQSLFDVFPNMSQDTFGVLVHCLAIDPSKRSLTAVKEALRRVLSFTTDDETLDEFCTENREIVTATANREPLRTPSITSPTPDVGDTFPWTKALRMPSPKGRQLSVIADNETASEDLFPGSEMSNTDWYSKAETRSIDSTVDSGLGLSLGSANQAKSNSPAVRSKPVPIASSMPTLGGRAGSAFVNIFGGKKKVLESKSWSDLCEEEEEEREREREERFKRPQVPPRPQINRLPTINQVDSSDDGRSTPRACLGEAKKPASLKARSESNESHESTESKDKDERISEHTGFIFDDHPLPPAPRSPSSQKRSLVDKWAALGDLRRGNRNSVILPAKEVSPPPDVNKRRSGASSWRRSIGKGFVRQSVQPIDHTVWQQKEWNMSQDWRRSTQTLAGSPLRPHDSQLDGAGDSDTAVDSEEEWVGGWKDLQL